MLQPGAALTQHFHQRLSESPKGNDTSSNTTNIVLQSDSTKTWANNAPREQVQAFNTDGSRKRSPRGPPEQHQTEISRASEVVVTNPAAHADKDITIKHELEDASAEWTNN